MIDILQMNIARWSNDEKKKNLQKFREEVPYRMMEHPFNSTYAIDHNLIVSKTRIIGRVYIFIKYSGVDYPFLVLIYMRKHYSYITCM